MDVIELIQHATSVDDVMGVLRAYGDALRDAALPRWWLQLPLAEPEHALRRLAALLPIVNAASCRLDGRVCRAGKQALEVFAVGVWKIKGLGGGAQAAGPPAVSKH
ncbi:MAG TPA: hypothetical protein VGN52_26100 [Burkholderiales bacterium]